VKIKGLERCWIKYARTRKWLLKPCSSLLSSNSLFLLFLIFRRILAFWNLPSHRTHFPYFLFIIQDSTLFPCPYLLVYSFPSRSLPHCFFISSETKSESEACTRKHDPMGSVPAELSLDLRLPFVPKTITDFLRHLSSAPDSLAALHDFLARLEDELRKIHAFKRELPLSMLLLNDG